MLHRRQVVECGLHFGEDHITMRRDDGSLLKFVWQTLLREEKV